MQEVFDEIHTLCLTYGLSLGEAVTWIKQHEYEYGSVFLCDFNRVLNGPTEGVNYEPSVA